MLKKIFVINNLSTCFAHRLPTPTRIYWLRSFQPPARRMEVLRMSSSSFTSWNRTHVNKSDALRKNKLDNAVCLVKISPNMSKVGSQSLLKEVVGTGKQWTRKNCGKAGFARAAVAEKVASVEEITLEPIKTISGKIKLPGSKSLSNRTLLLAALAEVMAPPRQKFRFQLLEVNIFLCSTQNFIQQFA